MISPRILNSRSACTMFFRAMSREAPQLNRWPNCESAYSCTRPLPSTEK